MKQQILKWMQEFNRRQRRERILLAAIAVVTVYLIGQLVVLDSVQQDAADKRRQIQTLQQQTAEQNTAIAALQEDLQGSKVNQLQKTEQQLQQQIAALDQQLLAATQKLIPPQQMAKVLEQVLANRADLQLVSLENKPVESVLTEDQSDSKTVKKAGEVADIGLYRHGFVLQLQGNYLATMNYCAELEKLPWRFYWDSLDYEVTEYPSARITLEVYTLSTQENWIGV